MCPDAPNFIILLCLMPDNCTRQGKSAATKCDDIIIIETYQ
jgi:hypothetical protein